MRRVAVLLLLVLAVGAVAAKVPVGSGEQPQVEALGSDDWRRTDAGWERAGSWNIDAPAPDPPLHPLVLALLQLLVSLLALVAYPGEGECWRLGAGRPGAGEAQAEMAGAADRAHTLTTHHSPPKHSAALGTGRP